MDLFPLSLSLSLLLSRPAVEGFQHPSGQFPTQTESLVHDYGSRTP
jgi:hypothetical protein